ncbi:hypothetical protein EZS27_027530 [termite gut metagenome]|uniref:DUF7149 domain-containing protein n=1 Tax=termite gut metagenome TaxID=433724 RepID=A0A5J4QPS3_9ZZZZ
MKTTSKETCSFHLHIFLDTVEIFLLLCINELLWHMSSNIESTEQALNSAFLKQKPERKEIELFKKEFISLLGCINESETGEFYKNLMIDFLNSVYYKDRHYINTKGRADLVIYSENASNSSVGVLIEVKSRGKKNWKKFRTSLSGYH